MIDIHAGLHWLRALLEGRAPLIELLGEPPDGLSSSIYADVAPKEAPYPFVLMQWIGGGDITYGTDQSLAMSPMTIQVKGCVEGTDNVAALLIADQIYQALQGQTTEMDVWKLNCYRREPFYMPIFRDSKHYRQAGGRYTVLARPLEENP